MEVLRDPGQCPPATTGSVVTIGAYDGVHLGHQHLIGLVRALAAELECASGVVTFDRHPAMVVRPESAPKVLTDLDQRLELLASTGIDYTLVVHFDRARSQESAEDFVSEVLVGCLRAQAVVVGHDFHFGYGRRGNVPLLQRMGSDLGFDVHALRLVGEGPGIAPVSSTRIRELLSKGDVAEAAELLGRPHEVRGRVVHGDQRGAGLGFPTANLAVPAEIQLPADGIYAGWFIRAQGEAHPAAVSLGTRPTFFDDTEPSVLEAHLLDFAGDLYDETAAVSFIARLRDQVRFDSVEGLIAQIESDIDATRQVLSR
jgi:riboflavin kinase/FMN adenylyltransferase